MKKHERRIGFENPEYQPIEADRSVVARSIDWPVQHEQPAHFHDRGQLVFASRGILNVTTEDGAWVVPPQRAVWIPMGIHHSILSKTKVELRTVYIDEREARTVPSTCCVIAVSPLLRELLLTAMTVPPDYERGGRDERVMTLIIDELSSAEASAGDFFLPLPRDRRVKPIVDAILDGSEAPATLAAWSKKVGASGRTIQRIFVSETGLHFDTWKKQAILLEALRKLSDGESVLNVALDLGYASPSAFTHMFRQAFGVAPSRFFD